MKQLIAIILFFSFSALSFAQDFTLDWQSPKQGINGKTLYFENSSFNSNNLPVFTTSFNKTISKAVITSAEFIPLSEKELKLVPTNFYQTDINPIISSGKSRGQIITSVSFIPLKNENGVWKKLVSFNLKTVQASAKTTKTTAYNWKSSSVFKNGTWYKLGITESGIYKIDRDFLINELGVDPNSITPSRIKIYGNGGAMLPQANAETWYDDPDENAIFVKGESDGSFDAADYILFYAQGAIKWSLSSDSTTFIHEKNRYSDTAYYFLNLTSSGNGKRISETPAISGASNLINTYDAYDVIENDLENPIHSGRNWYGYKFDFEPTKSYTFPTQGIISNPRLSITTRVGGVSLSSSSMQVLVNNSNLGTLTFDPYGDPNYPTIKPSTKTWDSISTSNSNQNITLSYNKGSSSAAVAYTDYVRINYSRQLAMYGNQTNFRSIESLKFGVSNFQVSNVDAGTQIWNITDLLNITAPSMSINGSTATFSAITNELQEFVVFSGANFPSPKFKSNISAQNIHELTAPNLLIITHPKFKSEAEQLAQHRRENDNLKVEIVNINHIFNEFSSGMEDPSAIRNLCKMFYDRNPETFKYLLLMGDCSYDYKNRLSTNTNYVTVYESRNSENPISSHSSDDYFALLDDNEGEWCTSCTAEADKEYLDIGVGRIPAKTVEEAKGVVNKIIYYDSQNRDIQECTDVTSYKSGKWKNEVVVIADDSDANRHLISAELVAQSVSEYPEYRVDKIYIDAYEQISGAGGQTAPTAKTEINRKMERGALIFNYSGHGGELGLSHEQVITVDQIRAWDNIENMPLMFTATCEFSRYDDPERTSAGEYTLLNDGGGVVGIVSTTRPVYGSENKLINGAFFGSVFEPIDSTTGEMPRLGDVMRNAKNGAIAKSNGVNNRNFALLGDPSMRLAYPQENVVLTSINENNLSDTIADTLQALSKVTMSGEIRDAGNNLISDFNGVVEVSIYDKITTYRTLGDENGSPRNFDERNTRIFEGLASVNEGKFEFSFVVPKDIKYNFGFGKAMFYAASDNLDTDAHGSNLDFIVGGSNPNAANDDTPPEINLFMDDESFVHGGTTGNSPVLLAKLFDEHGINTTGVGVGHEISAVLDRKTNDAVVLNEYYTSELNDYQNGVVKYPFENLSTGTHNITLKAWDTYNNSNEAYIEFVVLDDAKLALDHILNYPNPFTTNTSFHFDHNRACDDLQVMIQVYTISGKLIKTLQKDFMHAPAHISGIDWDGKDDFGQNIGRGVYIYRVKVRSLSDNAQVQEYQKLVILK